MVVPVPKRDFMDHLKELAYLTMKKKKKDHDSDVSPENGKM